MKQPLVKDVLVQDFCIGNGHTHAREREHEAEFKKTVAKHEAEDEPRSQPHGMSQYPQNATKIGKEEDIMHQFGLKLQQNHSQVTTPPRNAGHRGP